MKKFATAIIVMFLILGGVFTIGLTYEDISETKKTIELEQWEPNGTEVINLSQSHRNVTYLHDVDVYNSTLSLVNETNYTWDQSNGTIQPAASTDLENESEAYITYQFIGPTIVESGLATVTDNILLAAGAIVIVIMVIALVIWLIAGIMGGKPI